MEFDDREIIEKLIIAGIEQLSKVIKFLWREKANGLGLSPIQAEILLRISKISQEFNTIGSIAHDINVTSATISESVSALVQKGFAVRQRSQSDGRVQYVSPTKKGYEMAKKIEEVYKPLMMVMSDLSEDTLTQGLSFLGRYIQRLQEAKILPLDSVCETCPYRLNGGGSAKKHVCSFTYLAESWGHFCKKLGEIEPVVEPMVKNQTGGKA